jgi:CxxC-x17-CxxC domain-containing protein
MGDFKRSGGFGGNNRGGKPFKRREFGGGSSFGGRSKFNRPGNKEFRQSEMFSATCAECGKPCEVPFRPTGDKPVYCSYCFNKNKDGGSSDYSRRDESPRSFPKRDFAPSPAPRPQFDGGQAGDLKKQLDVINSKLDRILIMFSKNTNSSETKSAEIKIDTVGLSKAVKNAVKISTKKAGGKTTKKKASPKKK